MRPLLPDGLDFTAGLDGGAQLGRGTAVAHDFLVGDGHGRVVVGPLALDGLGAGGGGKAFVAKDGLESYSVMEINWLTLDMWCHQSRSS